MLIRKISMWGAIAAVAGFMDGDPDGASGGGGGQAATATPPAGQQNAAPAQNNAGGGTQQNQQNAGGGGLRPEYQAIVDAVQQSVDSRISPLTQRLDSLEQGLQSATQPAGNQSASTLYGGSGQAPAIRQGENVLASRGFEYQRAMRYVLDEDRGQAKHESEYCQFVKDAFMQMGFRPVGKGGRSIVVPMSSAQIPIQIQSDLNQKFGDFDQLSQQSVSGAGSDGASLLGRICQSRGIDPQSEMGHVYHQALSIFDESALGIFTKPGPKGAFISLLRAAEVLTRAGASQITLPPWGHLESIKQTSSGSAYWIGEAQTITTSEPGTGDFAMQAKKLAARVLIPNDLMMFGGPEVELFIRASMVLDMADALDLAGLEGTGGTTQPLGLLNRTGSGRVTSHTSSLTQATDGDTFEPETPGAMLSDLAELNHNIEDPSVGWVMRGKMWWDNILQRRAAAHTSGTYDGTWLFAANNEDIAEGKPARMHGKPVWMSTRVSNTRAKGSSSDLSYVLAGIWKHVIIGRVGVVEFATQVEGDTAFSTYQTGLRAVQHVDIGVDRETAFTLADKIDMDLP